MKLRKQDTEFSHLPLFSTDEKPKHEKIKNVSRVRAVLGMIQFSLIWKLLMVWLCVLHFFEREYPSKKIGDCKKGDGFHLVALIADPQIVDCTSYQDRFWLTNYITEKVSDNYLHRNYKYIQKNLDPDTIVFLGDLFDGGRDINTKAWLKEYKRFNRIFPKKENRRNIQSIPGNHDIGFEKMDVNVLNRFASFFGYADRVIEIANYSFIFLDTISLSSKDEGIRNRSAEFLDNIHKWLDPSKPRILLTHVPLFRQNKIEGCGPLREKKTLFPIQKGIQYQTVIDEQLLKEILNKIKPFLIFSGDDHDYCEIAHEGNDGEAIKEITVKSISMTSGIKYPAIQLLQLNTPGTDGLPRSDTYMCPLPPPYSALKFYAFFYVSFILILLASYFKQFARNLGFVKKGIQQYLPCNNNFTPRHTNRVPYVVKELTQEIVINIVFLSSLCYAALSIYYSTV